MLPRPRARAVLCLALALCLARRGAAQTACKGKQSFIFSVTTSFTPNVDPQIPQQKTFIPVMVAVAHTKKFMLFERGDFLIDEVAEVVTSGTTQKIEPLLRELQRNNSISSWEIIAEGREDNITVQGTTRFDLELKDDSSMVSILAPLSPSPDWFIGSSEDLCKSGQFVDTMNNVRFINYNAGLKKGSTWDSNVDPLEQRAPVSVLSDQGDLLLATAALERGSLGTNWWRILLIVLAVVAALALIGYFVVIRLKKKRPSDLPLTTNEGVEW